MVMLTYRAFFLNYREILGSCRFIQFRFAIDVFQVQACAIGGRIKQRCHLPLRQPHSVLIQRNIQLDLAISGLVEGDLKAGHQNILPCLSTPLATMTGPLIDAALCAQRTHRCAEGLRQFGIIGGGAG